jgi:hypothetical protein
MKWKWRRWEKRRSEKKKATRKRRKKRPKKKSQPMSKSRWKMHDGREARSVEDGLEQKKEQYWIRKVPRESGRVI